MFCFSPVEEPSHVQTFKLSFCVLIEKPAGRCSASHFSHEKKAAVLSSDREASGNSIQSPPPSPASSGFVGATPLPACWVGLHPPGTRAPTVIFRPEGVRGSQASEKDSL